MGTEQARVLVCMRLYQTSVLQKVYVCAPMRTRVVGVCAVCLQMAKMRLVEGALRKGYCKSVWGHTCHSGWVDKCVKWVCKPTCTSVVDECIMPKSARHECIQEVVSLATRTNVYVYIQAWVCDSFVLCLHMASYSVFGGTHIVSVCMHKYL